LTFTVTDGSTVQIEALDPKFYRKDSLVSPSWVYEPEGGCGDTYSRVFALNLDRRTLDDQGVQGSETDNSTPPPAAPLGPTFHVSKDDRATVQIQVTGCDAIYEWGIDVAYTVGGKSYVKHVGTAATPYQLIGAGGATNVPAYTVEVENGPMKPLG